MMGTGIRKALKMILCTTGLAAMLVISCIVGTRIERRDQQARELQKEHVSTIAVVNMDDGVLVRDEHVNYASQLMSFPSKNFTVTGLTDARSGIENGTYAAYVVIPETFSASVTSIESDPQKVRLNCQYNPRLDEEVRMQAMTEVNAFITLLNSNTAYMYLDAIMEEFHRVQDDSTTILANDDTELALLSDVDAGQLIAAAEPVSEIIVDNDIRPVELGAYTTQNHAIMDSMQSGYQQAVQKGKDDLAAIQEDRSGVEQASDTFFSTYESVLQDTASERESLLTAGRERLDEAVGMYNQDVEAQEEGVKEAILSMISMQLENDQKAADDQLDVIVEDMTEKTNAALDAQQEQWQGAYDALRDAADEMLLEKLGICQGNLSVLIRDIYKQGYNKALGDLADQIEEMKDGAGSDNIKTDTLKNTLDENKLKDEQDIDEYIKDHDTTIGDYLGDVTVKWDELETEHPDLPGGGEGENGDTDEGEDPDEEGDMGEGGDPDEGGDTGEDGDTDEGEDPDEEGDMGEDGDLDEGDGTGDGGSTGGDPGGEGEDRLEKDEGPAGDGDPGETGSDRPGNNEEDATVESTENRPTVPGPEDPDAPDLEEPGQGAAGTGDTDQEESGPEGSQDPEGDGNGSLEEVTDKDTVEDTKEDGGGVPAGEEEESSSQESTGSKDSGESSAGWLLSVGGLALYGAAGDTDDVQPAAAFRAERPDDDGYKITLSTIEDDAAVGSTITDTLDLFKLEPQAEEISNVIQTCFVDALSESGEQQMDRLSEAGMEMDQIVEAYEGRLRGYDPMGYIDAAELPAYLYDIEDNAGEMLGSVEQNNVDYMMYADQMYSSTTEHTAQLRESLEEAGTQTAANVESCIAGLIDSRKNVNNINTEMLKSFAGCLSYTRVESQGNAEVYDHIVNPVEDLVSGQAAAQAEQAPAKERSMKVWIIMLLGVGIVLFLVEMMTSLWRQCRKTAEEGQEEAF